MSPPLLRQVDAVTVPVPDLDAGLRFYRDVLGQPLLWRNDEIGQAGLGVAGSEATASEYRSEQTADLPTPPAASEERSERGAARRLHSEIVLSTRQRYKPNWLVDSTDEAAAVVCAAGGRMVLEPCDIPVGRLAVVADPFGNELVLLDLSRGRYTTDAARNVTGVQ